MDLDLFTETLGRLAQNPSNTGERVGTLIDTATSVAVAALAAELGVDLGRADVIGVHLTCSVDRDPGVLRATVVRLEPKTGLRNELTRYGQALAEVEVQIEADSQPRGVVVLTIEIGSEPAIIDLAQNATLLDPQHAELVRQLHQRIAALFSS